MFKHSDAPTCRPSWKPVLLLIGWIALCAAGGAEAAERLLPREVARRLGLEGAWFAQAQLDRARHRVERAVLRGDRLTLLTSAGVVQEFNALTGETVWLAPVGNSNYPSLGPAANDKYVAVINGSTLYVLDRGDGRPVLNRQVGGGPGAAPGLADEYAFVPLISGRMEGYPLHEPTRTPWYYQSSGRAMVPPLVTPESIIWSTDSGRLYVGQSNEPALRFRLDTNSEIVAPAAYRKPTVYVGSTDGDLFAMQEKTGLKRWKYSAGYPIIRAPAAVSNVVYVTTEQPALHAVSAETGSALWEAPNITQFAAASRTRVYGIDDLRALVVLDGKTGAVLDRMPTDGTANALVNDQTDRLYLLSEGGLVQCLHEIGTKEPLYHNPAPLETPETDSAADSSRRPATTDAEAPPTEEAAPPAGATPAAEDEDPFGDDADAVEEPAEAPPAENDFGVEEENPFGG
jgi:outer membrane protein assembly factor BamB